MSADGKPLLLGSGQDFMACIIGAAMCGVGLGITFNYNGSTGGTDDEHGNADKRPWNHFSRGGSGPGRADRCRGRNRCRVFKTACDD